MGKSSIKKKLDKKKEELNKQYAKEGQIKKDKSLLIIKKSPINLIDIKENLFYLQIKTKEKLIDEICCDKCNNGINEKKNKLCKNFKSKLETLITYKSDLEFMFLIAQFIKYKTPIIYRDFLNQKAKEIIDYYIMLF